MAELKNIYQLNIGDVVELDGAIINDYFHGTVKEIDLFNHSILVEESIFPYYQIFFKVIESKKLEGH